MARPNGSSREAQLSASPRPTSALDRVPAPALVVVAIASVQTGSAVARTVFDETGALGITLMRLAFSSLLLVAVLRPRPWRWSRDAQLATLLFGLAMAGMNIVFYLALRTVPLGVCVTVEFLGPLTVALVQTRRLRDLFWVVCAATGVALLGLRGGGDVPRFGLFLALLAGTFWALYILASARVGRLIPGTQGLALALVVAALVALPFGAPGVVRVLDQPSVLLVGCLVALLSSVIPYGFELAALRRIPTRVFGVLMSLEPAAAALAGLIVLGQSLDGLEVLALVLVSLASVGITLGRGSDQPAPQPLE
jgi:inner membrane transporter RhtA